VTTSWTRKAAPAAGLWGPLIILCQAVLPRPLSCRALPLSTTLCVLFLACHWLRLPLLPWDLCRLVSSGRLPFWRACEEVQLEAFPGFPAPLSAPILFMPHPKTRVALSARALELAATSLAHAGLRMELRQVNAPALALRFLTDLGLAPAPEAPQHSAARGGGGGAEGLFPLCAAPSQLPSRVLVMAAVLLALKLHSGLGLPLPVGPTQTWGPNTRQAPPLPLGPSECVRRALRPSQRGSHGGKARGSGASRRGPWAGSARE